MAKIPLRAYIKEIETQIERGEIDQAIAHSKNIIRAYPKHIDSYRLLGKAFLESQRYSEAADILQRVLSVIPDDFIAQIGMSIIREDEANLDAAIWHMERAYEVQPFNPAVQDELRRLYGRRDGVEPPKIRLTRGALVRMYMRGELYPQAIAEIRAALADDPQRYDLLVLLARLYNLSNQKFEATEVCSTLISKLPYCYEANSILAEILPGTSRADDAKKFQQRIYALDPYTTFISPTAPVSSQVPDQAVMVEHYEWNTTEDETQAPDWTRSIGVAWEESQEEELPDWINTLRVDPPASSVETTAAPVIEETQPPLDDIPSFEPQDDLVPDWMKEAGWAKSDRPADEIMTSEEETEEIVSADIPTWLQAKAPDLSAEEPTNESERTDWLENILEPPGDQEEIQIPEFPELENDNIGSSISWSPTAEIDETNSPKDEITSTLDEASTNWMLADRQNTPEDMISPDWLITLEQETNTPETSDEAGDLAWMAAETVEKKEQTIDEPTVPDWLKHFGEDIPVEKSDPQVPSQIESDQKSELEESNTLDWLKEFAQSEETEEDLTQPTEVQTTTAPNEISPASDIEAEIAAPASEEIIDQSEDDWMSSLSEKLEPVDEETENIRAENSVVQEPVDEINIDDGLAWLEGLAAKQGADEATLITPPDQRLDNPPDWLSNEFQMDETVISPEVEEPVSDEPDFVSLSEEPAELLETEDQFLLDRETRLSGETNEVDTPVDTNFSANVEEELASAPDFSDFDSAMAWLEGLAARQGADEATLTTKPEDRTEAPPDWVLQEMQPEDETSLPAVDGDGLEDAQQASSQEMLEIPDWQVETTVTDETDKIEPTQPVQVAPIEKPAEIAEPMAEEHTGQPDQKREQTDDFDSAFSWLESQAGSQDPQEGTLITPPDERAETPSPWPQPMHSDTDDAAANNQPIEYQQPEPETGTSPVPDWLQNIENEEPQVDEQQNWMTEFDQPENVPDDQTVEPETLPDWLQARGDEPLEPVIGQTDGVPDWLAGIGEEDSPLYPSEAEPSMSPGEFNSAWEPEIILQQSEQEAILQTSPSTLPELQAALNQGNIDPALDGYNKLIQNGENLEEIIRVLRDALYRYPVDIAIWQTLGDAYSRNSQLQDAIDAYTKAEELLR